jgi:hypothetical protein
MTGYVRRLGTGHLTALQDNARDHLFRASGSDHP